MRESARFITYELFLKQLISNSYQIQVMTKKRGLKTKRPCVKRRMVGTADQNSYDFLAFQNCLIVCLKIGPKIQALLLVHMKSPYHVSVFTSISNPPFHWNERLAEIIYLYIIKFLSIIFCFFCSLTLFDVFNSQNNRSEVWEALGSELYLVKMLLFHFSVENLSFCL